MSTAERNAELTEAIDLIDMEGWLDDQGIRYKRAHGSRGPQLNVHECPACGNTNWKVYIGRDTGLGNCFAGSCSKKTFNKWSFMKCSLPELTVPELVTHIKDYARRQGWRPKVKVEVSVQNPSKLRLPESISLPHNGRSLAYLDMRNVGAELVSDFHLRFCHKGAFHFWDELGKPLKQDYSMRVIIPVYNLDGDLVSFQGRDITNKAEKKYLFPPGYSTTGRYLYNAHRALRFPSVCVGEGVFDTFAIEHALKTHKVADVAAIGTFGKHLSTGQEDSQLCEFMKLRDLGLKEVTFMWDGESQAIHDAIEAALMLRKYGLVTRVAILPADRDPAEVTTQVIVDAYWGATRITEMTAAVLMLKHKVSCVTA